MSRNRLALALLALIALIALLHHAALSLYLYWLWWWFDIVVHFLSGLWVGLAILWIAYLSGYTAQTPSPRRPIMFVIVLVSVLSIGIGWEVFEFWARLSLTEPYPLLDTVNDMAADLAGTLLAYLLFTRYAPVPALPYAYD